MSPVAVSTRSDWVSTTVPGRPLSKTPSTFVRSSNFLPAEVGGRGLKDWRRRWPSTTRVASKSGTPGMATAFSAA